MKVQAPTGIFGIIKLNIKNKYPIARFIYWNVLTSLCFCKRNYDVSPYDRRVQTDFIYHLLLPILVKMESGTESPLPSISYKYKGLI